MLLEMSSLRVLFLGNKIPGSEIIQQWLSDGFRCSVFFDSATYYSDFDQWKVYSKYDFILVDHMVERFQTFEFHKSIISSGIPVFFLYDTPETATSFALMGAGAEGYLPKNDPVQLLTAIYKTMKSRVIPKRSRDVCISNDKELFAQEILDNLTDAFYSVDSNWCFTYINHKAETCWGRNRNELLGKCIWDSFLFSMGSPEKENHYTAMKERIPMQWESSSLDKEFWLEIRVYPVMDGGLAVFFCDITEKKHAEDVLRLSRDRQAIMLRLSDSIRLMDSPSDIHEAVAHIIGEYLGVDKAFYCDVVTVDGVDYFLLEKQYSLKDKNILPGLHPIDSPGVLTSENFEGRNVVVCDMETDPRISDDIRPSLRQVELAAWISVPLMRNGKFVAGFTVHQSTPRSWSAEEISLIEETTARTWAEVDRVRAEAALRKSEQRALQLVSELENADRNKNEFINALSHELRNPLASIVASLSMLDIIDRNPETKKTTDIIKRQTNHLCHLVDDLLDLTRINNNKVQLNLMLFDLNELVQSSAYDVRSLFEEKGIELITHIAESPLYIKADPVRLSQIIGNLLHNASKFTKKGGKTTLSVYRQRHEAVIVVKDNGIGIEAAYLPELFKTFKQAEPNKGGLGLGLSIVKGIVEIHGGTVDAKSDGLNQGAAFTVRLPLPANLFVKESVDSKIQEQHPKPLKILLIDDNRDLAEITSSLLTLYGYDVISAYSGLSGIQKATEFLPHVIICDIGLPDIDGYEVARRILELKGLGDICLISLSGYTQASDYEYSIKAGFRLHISKPVDFENLKSVLDSLSKQ